MRPRRYDYLDKLREDIRKINPHSEYKSPLYRVLKEELSRIGHWKGMPRGAAAHLEIYRFRKQYASH